MTSLVNFTTFKEELNKNPSKTFIKKWNRSEHFPTHSMMPVIDYPDNKRR